MLYPYGMSQKRPSSSLAVAMLCFGLVSCDGQGEQPSTDGKGPASKPPKKVGGPAESQMKERPDAPTQEIQPDAPVVVFHRDRAMVVARVRGQDITVEEIIRHIDKHSYKGYLDFAERGHLDHTLSSPKLPTWARQFADRRALELMARKRESAPSVVDKERKRLATEGFLKFLEAYKSSYRLDHGRDYPENPRSVASLRRRYLLEHGLALEREAWLNTLVPDELTQEQADWYLRTQPQIFNGYLDIAVITIHNRDRKTGALCKGTAKAEVTKKLLDIKSRLENDGSNFEKVATRFSDVAKERDRAGVFSNISRFDPRLPAVICRTAWGLRNGKFKGPVESPFGLHFVKRIRYLSKSMVMRLDPKVPEVRRYIRRLRQEDMVFRARREQKVELIY